MIRSRATVRLKDQNRSSPPQPCRELVELLVMELLPNAISAATNPLMRVDFHSMW